MAGQLLAPASNVTYNGSVVTANQTHTVTINWSLGPGVPQPDYYEILVFTGTDPTQEANWIAGPIQTPDGTMLSYTVSIAPGGTLSNLNVAVRSVYLNQSAAYAPALPPTHGEN